MNSRRRPRVLLVDDHDEILIATQRLLTPICDVVGSIRNSLLALDTVLVLRPDVVVLDLNMPGRSGLDLCREILESAPAIRVVILTAMTDDEIEREAYRRGASALVPKTNVAERLPSTIRQLFEGEPPVQSA